MRIDLNSDLGENFGTWRKGDEAAMLGIVTSANVACGFHAGDPESILGTLERAAENRVSVGAHIGYPDLVGFCRRAMALSAAEIKADAIYQIGALQGLATAAGTTVSYVKPHGALYNTIAHDEVQGSAVIAALLTIAPELPLLCLAGSPYVEQVRAAGLTAVTEAFADRAYEPNGQLVSRREAGATLHDPTLVAERMLRMVRDGVIEARDGSDVAIAAESICVHGDSEGAVQMAAAVRDRLVASEVSLNPFTAPT